MAAAAAAGEVPSTLPPEEGCHGGQQALLLPACSGALPACARTPAGDSWGFRGVALLLRSGAGRGGKGGSLLPLPALLAVPEGKQL